MRGCCPFTVGPWASAHAGEHVASKQVLRTSCQRPEHWGARDLRHRTLSFLHPTPGTSGDIAARNFLRSDSAGVLASQGQRLAQLSAWGKLPASPLEEQGSLPALARASVQGRGLHRHGAQCCHLALQQHRLETWHIHIMSVGRSCEVPPTACQKKTEVRWFFLFVCFAFKKKKL